MTTPAGNEITVSVRIDGSAAMRDADKVGSSVADRLSKNISRGVGAGVFGMVGLAGAALGVFYGGVARQTASAAAGFGDMLGRGTQFGQDLGAFAGRLGAKGTAAEQTVAAFGFAGKQATKEQVLGVYNVFKNMDELAADSRAKILGDIGQDEKKSAAPLMKEAAEIFKNAAANFGDKLREWGYYFGK
jgi:hypothetical protein